MTSTKKKKKMRPSLFIIFWVLISCCSLKANIAQPGVWQAGGMHNYALLFPEDNLAFQKVQMIDERVSILLYPGFAVVKGEYWMQNNTDSTLQFKAGYPINSSSEGRNMKLTQIIFDDLYALKVYADGSPLSIQQIEQSDNWYIWQHTFEKQSTTKVDVYFLMNTNNASVLQGYSKQYSNAFIYLLESGASWKLPILKGEIRLQVQDNLRLNSIKGGLPVNFFQQNKMSQILRGRFNALAPSSADNIVLTYGKRLDKFNFEQVLQQQEEYFAKADALSALDLDTYSFEPISLGNPFHVPDFDGLQPTGLWSWMQVIFYGFIFLLGTLIVFLIYKRRKR